MKSSGGDASRTQLTSVGSLKSSTISNNHTKEETAPQTPQPVQKVLSLSDMMPVQSSAEEEEDEQVPDQTVEVSPLETPLGSVDRGEKSVGGGSSLLGAGNVCSCLSLCLV